MMPEGLSRLMKWPLGYGWGEQAVIDLIPASTQILRISCKAASSRLGEGKSLGTLGMFLEAYLMFPECPGC